MNPMKTVLISGGSRGIGAACVATFALAGYRVAFIYKSNHEAADALAKKYDALAICADVSSPAEASNAVDTARKELGSIDVLINNAGVCSFGLMQDTSDEEWARVMGTNLDGAFYLTKAVLPDMISKHSGAILQISSMWGQVGSSMEVAYSTSKAALIGFTKALSKEVGPSGITVNCIAPGVIDTDMNKHLDCAILKELADQTPLCRLGSAQDVANAALFLVSENASFITGQVLGVDGGYI